MATNDSTRYTDLKARVAALNCELLQDQTDDDVDDHYYVLDKAIGKLVSVCASLKDTYNWLEVEEEERQRKARAIAAIVEGTLYANDLEAWTAGARAALDLLKEAADVGTSAAGLEAEFRKLGESQNNFVLRHLDRVAAFGEPRVTAAFAAVLSDYIATCESGGVPDFHFMERISAAAPGPGTQVDSGVDRGGAARETQDEDKPDVTVLADGLMMQAGAA